ncbi:MAG: hypothetical protein HQK65_01975 [Desulfamplus sp.]|nr:hypothetical protein [Desulfamplus sp.]
MELFKTKRNKQNVLEWESFNPYDIKAAEKRLQPEERAHEFATSDSKTSVNDETELTTPEIEMVADVNDYILQLSDWHTHIKGDAKDYVINLTDDIDPDFQIKKIRANFKKNVNQALANFKYNVENIYIPLKNAYRKLNAFQLKHCIENHRDAEYPESKFFNLAVLFTAIFAEALINSFFFAKIVESGVAGGLIVAAFIALANVSLSFLAGVFFLRQCNYVEKNMRFSAYMRKVMGITGFAVCLVLIFAFHLFVAHYRELNLQSIESGMEQNTIAALKHLAAEPFNLQDILSWVLIIIGWGISIIGIWKGYTFDDRFPRYGSVFRSWKELDNAMTLYRNEFQREINRHYDDAVESTHAILTQIKKGKKDLENIQGSISAMLNACSGYYQQARNGAVSLISTFRNTVQQIYNDPNSFNYNDSLLEKANGIASLDFAGSKDEVEGLLLKTIDNLNKMEKEFPAKQDSFIHEIGVEQTKYLDETNIDGIIKQIKNRQDKQASEMKDVK